MDLENNRDEENKVFQVPDLDQAAWTTMKKVPRMENGKPMTNNGDIVYNIVVVENKFKKEVAMEKWKTKHNNVYKK